MVRTVSKKDIKYTATGRRKTAIARVFLSPGSGKFIINKKEPVFYLGNVVPLLNLIKKPLEATKTESKYDINAWVHGGGTAGQADAIRLGVARALVKINADYKGPLKAEGLLTRDPRSKERKKYGRKKARKRFQFSKR